MQYNEPDDSTPASKEYWEIFYTEGPGIKNYEWYNITFDSIKKFLIKEDETTSLIKNGYKCLQVGS
jgi:hypothetical protein